MFKKILFPTDGSENSKRTLEYVLEFALKFESEVLILHTYEPPVVPYAPYAPLNSKDLTSEMEEHYKIHSFKLIEAEKNAIEAKGINTSTILEKGHPGHVITRLAESEKCDLIIMGSHGLGTLGSLLLGSTSNYVIHHTKCPVLLVH